MTHFNCFKLSVCNYQTIWTNQPIQTEPANRITQEGLESMQADPRYWDPVKRDPAFVEKVREGYTKLYNGG